MFLKDLHTEKAERKGHKEMHSLVSRKYIIPLTATFAAIYGTLRLVPISVWIGGSGRAFTATEFFAPLLGILLGPYPGSFAGMIGTFIGIMLTGRMNYFGLDFLPVMMNALVLGFLMRKRQTVSTLLYTGLLFLFFVHPSTLHFVSVPLFNGQVLLPFAWFHLVAWILIVSPLSGKAVDWVFERTTWKAALAASVLTLIGTTAQHLTGTLLFATLAVPAMGVSPETLPAIWNIVFYVYPFERLTVIAAGTIVTTATVRSVVASRLLVNSAQKASP